MKPSIAPGLTNKQTKPGGKTIKPIAISDEERKEQAAVIVSAVLKHCSQKWHDPPTCTPPTEETTVTMDVAATREVIEPTEKTTETEPERHRKCGDPENNPTKTPAEAVTESKRSRNCPTFLKDFVVENKAPKRRSCDDPKDESRRKESQSDPKELHCICKTEWQDGVTYIGCDICEKWFHPTCVQTVINMPETEGYQCPSCRSASTQENQQQEEKSPAPTAQAPGANPSSTKTTDQDKSRQNQELAKNISKLTKENTSLISQMAELKESHERELDLKQISLENILAQNQKLTRENEQHTRKASVLNKKIEDHEKMIKTLSDDNAAHLDFIKTSLESNEMLGDFEKLKQQCVESEEKIRQKDLRIAELERETTPEGSKQKIASAKKTIDSLTAQIRSFEVTVSELQENCTSLQQQLQVKSANYDRELELNNILMKRVDNVSAPKSPTSAIVVNPQKTSTEDKSSTLVPVATAKKPLNPKTKSEDRGPCCYEFTQQNSCKFKEKCMFSHKIENSMRQNRDIQRKMEAIMKTKQNRRGTPPTTKPKICVNEFFEEGSCTYSKNGKRCWFSHDITETMKSDRTTRSNMEDLQRRLRTRTRPSDRNASQINRSDHLAQSYSEAAANTPRAVLDPPHNPQQNSYERKARITQQNLQWQQKQRKEQQKPPPISQSLTQPQHQQQHYEEQQPQHQQQYQLQKPQLNQSQHLSQALQQQPSQPQIQPQHQQQQYHQEKEQQPQQKYQQQEPLNHQYEEQYYLPQPQQNEIPKGNIPSNHFLWETKKTIQDQTIQQLPYVPYKQQQHNVATSQYQYQPQANLYQQNAEPHSYYPQYVVTC